jgi:type II secretory pathway component GspD/PulD (secretin)
MKKIAMLALAMLVVLPAFAAVYLAGKPPEKTDEGAVTSVMEKPEDAKSGEAGRVVYESRKTQNPADRNAKPEKPKKEESPEEKIKNLLENRIVTLTFDGATLAQVVSFLQDITKLNIAIDPTLDIADKQISLNVREILLKNALNIICDQIGMVYAFKENVIFITTAENAATLLAAKLEKPKKEEPPEEKIKNKLENQKVTLSFTDTPFAEAINFLRDVTGLNIVIAPSAWDVVQAEDLRVDLKIKDVRLKNALMLILRIKEEFTYKIKNGVVYITTAEASKEPESETGK